MKGVQLTKMVQELELNNMTPEIDLSGIVIKTAEINRPALHTFVSFSLKVCILTAVLPRRETPYF